MAGRVGKKGLRTVHVLDCGDSERVWHGHAHSGFVLTEREKREGIIVRTVRRRALAHRREIHSPMG